MNQFTKIKAQPAPKDWDRRGLPGWAYHSKALLKLEMEEIFLTHWQIVGHVSDIAQPGDFITLDVGPERVVVIRGQDGAVRALHNLCRHRGSRVVGEAEGNCRNAMVCPFHGWVYNLDGTLRGAARPGSFGAMDKGEFGLKPVESGIWHGFIFVRFKPGPQGTLEEAMAPYDEDLAAYRFEDLVPAKKSSSQEIPVNWKSVRDVDNEGYHVAMAHPALQDLYGPGYHDLFLDHGRTISFGPLTPGQGRRWSVRHYLKLAADHDWLPEGKRRLWSYFGLFPNAVLAVTPESVSFYHEFPLGVDRTLLMGRSYRRRDENRRQRAARYLAARIDNETYKEDIQLSIWSNEAMKSSAFDRFHLSDLEYGVRNHHDELRRILPVLLQDQAPADGEMADLNSTLRKVLPD